MQFLKSNEVQLINGGHLSSNTEQAVYNKEFIDCQKRAEYLATLCKHLKGKDFVGKKPDKLKDVRESVSRELDSKKIVEYLTPQKSVQSPTTDKLKKEALNFIKYTQKNENIEEINLLMQEFNVVKDFEEYGLYFEEGLVRLNKIYSIEEITGFIAETLKTNF